MKKKIKALLIIAGIIDLGILMILLNVSVMLAVGLGILHILWTYIVYNAIVQITKYSEEIEEEERNEYTINNNK